MIVEKVTNAYLHELFYSLGKPLDPLPSSAVLFVGLEDDKVVTRCAAMM